MARLAHSKDTQRFGWVIATNIDFEFANTSDIYQCEQIFQLYPINPQSIFDGHILLDTEVPFTIKLRQFDLIADIKQYNWTPINLYNHDLCQDQDFRDTVALSLIQDLYYLEMMANTHLHKTTQMQDQLNRATVWFFCFSFSLSLSLFDYVCVNIA